MSLTCLPWPTTGATLHSVRIMQKCAQNVQKCAKKSFFGQILAKKRIFDPRQKFFLLFSFQKWIPLEKLDIKHVLYDFLHAISIIFKGVKKNLSIALSNYTRNSCGWGWCRSSRGWCTSKSTGGTLFRRASFLSKSSVMWW